VIFNLIQLVSFRVLGDATLLKFHARNLKGGKIWDPVNA